MLALFGVVFATIFTALGVLTLLDDWTEKSGTPRRWAVLSKSRRSFFTLFAAVVGGMVVGWGSWYKAREDKQELSLLFDLEVLLAQLEGLISVTIVQGEIRNAIESIELLVGKIGEYGFKASRLLGELEKRLSSDDYQDLKRGAMAITVGVEALKTMAMSPQPSPAGAAGPELINMQSGIRLARAQTRRLIDERSSVR